MQPAYTVALLRAKRYSEDPTYLRLADTHMYTGMRKAGFLER